MNHLVFQLHSPLSSWGEPAVGEFRGTGEHPTQSALIGLIGAALGTDRTDEAAHADLRDSFGFAVGLLSTGSLLRDYHTTQVPSRAALKGWPHTTRRDELKVPKTGQTTILSSREYRQSGAYLVALQQKNADSRFSLSTICQSLSEPRFVLYLGRKSCIVYTLLKK